MKRTIIIVVALAIAATLTPWVIGWRTEQLVRARVAQVEADKASRIRLRVDQYERGWRGANARISVIDRDGTPLITLPATIRHWPFASGGPADWVAVPELGSSIRDTLGPWAEKLPELTTRTQLSWSGNVLVRIESPSFKRRVPEVAGGSFEIAAVSGTVDWRRDGAFTYEFALPFFRVERQPIDRSDARDIAEFKDAVLRGDGSLGTVERRWNQKGSLSAASVSVTDAGTTILTAASPLISYTSRDEGEFIGMQFNVAASAIGAKHALQNLSDAAIEFDLDARHIAKEPLGRLLDAAAIATSPPVVGTPAPGLPRRAAPSDPLSSELFDDLMRGSPAADLRFMLKAREGRVEIRLALAFDGQGYDPKISSGSWLQRLDAELSARASTSLVVIGTRAGADVAARMMRPGGTAGKNTPPDVPSPEADAIARQQLAAAATAGWIRIEGDEVATTVLWRKGNVTINGQDMNALRDLARGLTGR